MATITKQILSGSTQGKSIQVTGDATAGAVTVHPAVGGTTDIDEIWVWASNTDASDIKLTIEWGNNDTLADTLVVVVAGHSTELVVPGLVLQNGLVIEAFAGTASKIHVFGYVHRLDY